MLGRMSLNLVLAVIYIYTSELFPTEVRNSVVGASSTTGRISGMIGAFVGGPLVRARTERWKWGGEWDRGGAEKMAMLVCYFSTKSLVGLLCGLSDILYCLLMIPGLSRDIWHQEKHLSHLKLQINRSDIRCPCAINSQSGDCRWPNQSSSRAVLVFTIIIIEW